MPNTLTNCVSALWSIEKEDEEDEDGFVVPHGYLSDDEGLDAEEPKTDKESRKSEAQAAELQAKVCFLFVVLMGSLS